MAEATVLRETKGTLVYSEEAIRQISVVKDGNIDGIIEALDTMKPGEDEHAASEIAGCLNALQMAQSEGYVGKDGRISEEKSADVARMMIGTSNFDDISIAVLRKVLNPSYLEAGLLDHLQQTFRDKSKPILTPLKRA